jgi:hypothetical protein
MQASPKWAQLADDQREALDMIVHKIGRILNGDPNYQDSWQDIVGYAKLVADRLTSEQRHKTSPGEHSASVPHSVNAAHGLTDAVKRAARKR